jgi:hypothetical protein
VNASVFNHDDAAHDAHAHGSVPLPYCYPTGEGDKEEDEEEEEEEFTPHVTLFKTSKDRDAVSEANRYVH